MNDPGKTRFTSEVRSLRQRTEPLAATPSTTGVPFEKPKPRTTRFRLERVSLLPFVPAPLIAYVERARVRRRARWLVLAAVLGGAASFVTLWFALSDIRPSAVTVTPKKQGPSAPARESLRTAVPSEPASLGPSPLPIDSATSEGRESVPASRPTRVKRMANDGVDRSARPPPKGASSAWWW